jgi:hypothetical protein
VAIYGALIFKGMTGTDEKMMQITERAEAALRKIGEETAMNALRVKKYGISIPVK